MIMKGKIVSYIEAVEMVTDAAVTVDIETVPLAESYGRILAQEIKAADNVPPFDRSPLDGYAFRAEDSADASKDNPVSLKVLEEIPAGEIPHVKITKGTAVRLMTGAPIPEGADAVTMYEITEFTDTEVKIFRPSKSGDNIVRAGEDIKKGTVLAEPGQKIDVGLMGTLASQGISEPKVYKKLKVGIISTGSELQSLGEELKPGMIYDSNQYTFTAALQRIGMEPVRYGTAKDTVQGISEAIGRAFSECDALLLTGGVSAGDFDLTPDAMEMSGIEILFRGVGLKPGMSCAFGHKEGRLVCALSGNPATALTTFYVVAAPGLKKMAGVSEYRNKEIELTLADNFEKASKAPRVLRGRLDLSGGTAQIRISEGQGNVILSSAIGSDCMAVISAGSGPQKAGTVLKGFLI